MTLKRVIEQRFTSGERPSRRILLADREPTYLLGLRHVIANTPGIVPDGEALDSKGLLKLAAARQPDIIFAGFVLRCGRDAFSFVRELKACSRRFALIIVIPTPIPEILARLARLGVDGMVERCATPDVFTEALAAVADGNRYIQTELQHSRPRPGSTAAHTDLSILTDRELQVFRLIGQHKSNKDVAAILGISPKTADAHRENIKAKLRAGTATALAVIARAYALWECSGIDYLI